MYRFVTLALAFAGASLQAQTCSGTQDFSGPYVFTAVRLLYAPLATPPPGTTAFIPQPMAPPGTTGQYSTTPIGQLVGYSSNLTPFSSAGRVLADGAGVLYAGRAGEPEFVRAGTYTVDLDCSIAVTLSDGFTTPALPAVSFKGVLTDRGGEANLIQSSNGGETVLNFVRPFLANGCSAQTVSGAYGLSGFGVDASTPAAVTPLSWALRIVADGAGTIGSPNGAAGYTGTYQVNSDCTGTLSLVTPDGKTTRKLAFILTAGNAAAGQVPRAAMLTVFNDPGKLSGIGEGR